VKETYLVFCEDIDEVVVFEFSYFAFVGRIVILLSNRVVDDILVLDELVGYFFVLGRLVLQVSFFV
jgi:hypothetical protein